MGVGWAWQLWGGALDAVVDTTWIASHRAKGRYLWPTLWHTGLSKYRCQADIRGKPKELSEGVHWAGTKAWTAVDTYLLARELSAWPLV